MLKLYNLDDRLQAVERVQGIDIDHSCTLCPLHKGNKSICMSPEGVLGGLLVVSDYPGTYEVRAGRPFVGPSGQLLRRTIKKYWSGPIAYDNALKCAPGSKEIKKPQIDACRAYLAKIVEEVKPTRILALGRHAIHGLTGRSPTPLSARSGWGWLSDNTPIYFSVNPAAAARNRFIAAWFEEDLRRALSEPIPQQADWEASTTLV